MRHIEEMIKEQKENILEDIQEAIIKAGGCFFRREEIARMSVNRLLTMCIPNSVYISVEYKRGVLK